MSPLSRLYHWFLSLLSYFELLVIDIKNTPFSNGSEYYVITRFLQDVTT